MLFDEKDLLVLENSDCRTYEEFDEFLFSFSFSSAISAVRLAIFSLRLSIIFFWNSFCSVSSFMVSASVISPPRAILSHYEKLKQSLFCFFRGAE